MGQDYYAHLEITRSANDAEIKKSYRRLALKHHPVKTGNQTDSIKFRQLCEAYDILSNGQRKAIYDQFGEEGLKRGVPLNEEGFTKGYTFHGDPERVFKDFFGGDNPFSELFDVNIYDVDVGFGGLQGRGRKTKDSGIEEDLFLTLEEAYHGCMKKVKISRKVLNADGHTSSIRSKILTIQTKPGWHPGTKLTFPNEGDQEPNNIPADITFVLRDKIHPVFKRVGVNLYYTADIALTEALTGSIIDIPTLDDRTISVPITDIVRPGFQKIVKSEGMPLPSNFGERGDLVINFNLVFPTQLSTDQKALLKKAFMMA